MGNQKYAWNVMMKTEEEDRKNRKCEGKEWRDVKGMLEEKRALNKKRKQIDEKRHVKKKGVKTSGSY